MTNLELINQAISEKKIITFIYDGELRGVEPFLTGKHKDTGKLSLRAWWLYGYTKSSNPTNWRLYTIELMSNIAITNDGFIGQRPYYNPNDKDMSNVYNRV